mgnify:CR=1 FL=1
MFQTIIQIYLGINIFLVGTIWQDIRITNFSLREITGTVAATVIFILFALPIFIIGQFVDYYYYKKKNKFISSNNILYFLDKKLTNTKHGRNNRTRI